MINDQSTRLMAMARIQGTGEECRMIEASRVDCRVDWGMVVPSDLVAGSKTLSVTALARAIGPRWHFEPIRFFKSCMFNRVHVAQNRRLNQPPSTDCQLRRAVAPPPAAEQRDREFLRFAKGAPRPGRGAQ